MNIQRRLAKLEIIKRPQTPIFVVSNDLPLDRMELINGRGIAEYFDRLPDETEQDFRGRCASFANQTTAPGHQAVLFQHMDNGTSF